MMSRISSSIDKLLIFHRELGSDDETASFEERSERLLLYYSSSDDSHDARDHKVANPTGLSRIVNITEPISDNQKSCHKKEVIGSKIGKTYGDESSLVEENVATDEILAGNSAGEKKLAVLNMLESLLEFSQKFCRKTVDYVLTEKYFWTFLECEENIFICAAVPRMDKKDKRLNQVSRRKINSSLREMYRHFVALNGSIDSILSSTSSFSTYLHTNQIIPVNENISVNINYSTSNDEYDTADNKDITENLKHPGDSETKTNVENNSKIGNESGNELGNYSNDNITQKDDITLKFGWDLINTTKNLRKKIRKLMTSRETLVLDILNRKSDIGNYYAGINEEKNELKNEEINEFNEVINGDRKIKNRLDYEFTCCDNSKENNSDSNSKIDDNMSNKMRVLDFTSGDIDRKDDTGHLENSLLVKDLEIEKELRLLRFYLGGDSGPNAENIPEMKQNTDNTNSCEISDYSDNKNYDKSYTERLNNVGNDSIRNSNSVTCGDDTNKSSNIPCVYTVYILRKLLSQFFNNQDNGISNSAVGGDIDNGTNTIFPNINDDNNMNNEFIEHYTQNGNNKDKRYSDENENDDNDDEENNVREKKFCRKILMFEQENEIFKISPQKIKIKSEKRTSFQKVLNYFV